MAQRMTVIAKGQWRYFCSLPGTSDRLVLVLFKTGTQAHDVLDNYVDLASLKANNTEADFTNYIRIELTTGIVITPNNTTNTVDLDFPDQTISAAGGGTNNGLSLLVVCYRPSSTAADVDTIPLFIYDFTATTNGSDLIVRPDVAGLVGSS